MLIVDKSVWIDFLRGEKTKASELLRELISSEKEMHITEIILTEILQGIKDDRLYHITKEYLLYFPILKPKGIETYIRASEIFRNCRKQGKALRKTIDCIIASIVIENKATIIHKDIDFEKNQRIFGTQNTIYRIIQTKLVQKIFTKIKKALFPQDKIYMKYTKTFHDLAYYIV